MKSEIAIVCWMLTQLSHCKIPLVGRAKSLRSWPSCLWLPRSNSNGYLTSCTHPGELVIRCETQNTTHQSVCQNIYQPMSLSGVEFSLIKHRWFCVWAKFWHRCDSECHKAGSEWVRRDTHHIFHNPILPE